MFNIKDKKTRKGIIEVSGPFSNSKAPINNRPGFMSSRWPSPNRPNYLSTLPESRTYKGLFRRYPNGELDYQWASSKVEEAVSKMNKGIPLTELESVAIGTVFPSVRFNGLPSEIIKSKGSLSSYEVSRIKKTLSASAVRMLHEMSIEI
jgi:hypothetical protein